MDVLTGTKTFDIYDHTPKIIFDNSSNKEREIIVPDLHEHIIHHMLISSLKPLFTIGMYDHTYSSIPGRGLHKCSRYIRRKIDNQPRDCKYFMQLDIHKFFGSINHNTLKDILRLYIHDIKIRELLFSVIDVTDRGLPIGFYTSHWLANWFLQPLDHMISERWGAQVYARYMDDMIIGGSNKRELHRMLDKIRFWLEGHGLELKPNYQIYRFDYIDQDLRRRGRSVDFIGFRFFRDKTLLRKSIMMRMIRKANHIGKKGYMNITDAHQMMSYLGWISWADVYHVYTEFIAPHVTFKQCSKFISQYDKKYKNDTPETPGEAMVSLALDDNIEKEVP